MQSAAIPHADPQPMLGWSRHLSLTTRILAVNLFTIALTAFSFFYLDNYRADLVRERLSHAEVETELIAAAISGRSTAEREALLADIGRQQKMRLMLYTADGAPQFDSFTTTGPLYTLVDPASEPWQRQVARAMDQGVDWVVNAPDVPAYAEAGNQPFGGRQEAMSARDNDIPLSQMRYAADRTPMISAAIRLGDDENQAAVLHTTVNARDVRRIVRDQRAILGIMILAGLLLSILLSLFLARTIVRPLRLLSRAAMQVRQGRAREVEVPRLPDRRDEIGMLARSLSDMTGALRQRIDATESFAADVAHEIKNPLASLQSAIETLPRVDDPALRDQLMGILRHDVIRIDRLINEIADASRVDAQLTRTRFTRIDLGEMLGTLIATREKRGENQGQRIAFARPRRHVAEVMGEAPQLERVMVNLLDNAVSFSPDGGVITISATRADDQVLLKIMDEGPGIPEAQREAVFRRFHSDRPQNEAFGNHSGLGLAIARTIIKAHDGTIAAGSREDGSDGACITITLPAAPVAPAV